MTAEGQIKAVVFDLDGTLIDSAPDIAAAVNRVLAEHGWAPLETDYVERFIGDGPKTLLLRILQEQGLPTDDAFVEASKNAYLQNYAEAPATHTTFFAHVAEDLRALKASGLRLGICTNKPHGLTQTVLSILGIAELFDSAIGADAAPRRKPDAAHLLAVVDAMGLDKDEIAYVGDTEVDSACARSAGVPFFIVPWGGGSHVVDADATRISRLRDLLFHLGRAKAADVPA
ncbi:phosphoglycolate phosphatase [Jiella pacifica]|uniref:phosphoglycolate phosphatase n=1 Tax=Jiella pacifica TaxID=2696469 RepID=A0A6N9TAP3_9HYPH|nr:phosphoglycolate phosphatase [Jiella pacifica]NDW05968.1 phosphoglycolate phosphatase [Jiella pacifica]